MGAVLQGCESRMLGSVPCPTLLALDSSALGGVDGFRLSGGSDFEATWHESYGIGIPKVGEVA